VTSSTAALIVAFLIGLAVIAVLAGIALIVVAILRASRYETADRPVQPGELPEDARPVLPLPEPRRRGVDRFFHQLVVESGDVFDENTAIAMVVGGGIVGAAIPLVLWNNMLAVGGGLLIGVLLPIFLLSFLRWRRLRRMRSNLPETLQVVADAIRSGRTLQQTFEMAATEIDAAMGPEFARSAKQLELGHPPVFVLSRLIQRIPLPEFRIFSTAVVVHEATGGNLALLTERLAAGARDREQFYGHLGAVTAGSRLSAFGLVLGPLIGALVLMWIQPTYLGIFLTSPYGPPLLAIAAALQIVGIIWVWRVLRLRY